jgi:carboxymethylenebutenolidase
MIVKTRYVDLQQDDVTTRCFLVEPVTSAPTPGIVFYSDIFQLSGSMLRACVRLAGHGFTVLAPEIYSRTEPLGSVIPFDDAGRTRGLDNAARTPVAHFDADARAALAFLAQQPGVDPARLGAAGFCLGGHLALRAALQPEVRATTCFYATGVHNGRLGADADAGTLQRLSEIGGQLLLVWGEQDPHIPPEARALIESSLTQAGVAFQRRSHQAEHAFMRDEGPRHDPEASDLAWAEAIAFFRKALG